MNTELPPAMLLFLAGAFAAGWGAAKLGVHFGRRWFGSGRDPKDDRIRSLEAELRVAHSSLDRAERDFNAKVEELSSSQGTVDEYAKTMNDQAAEIERLALDLRDSVEKTNELRAELTTRAEESTRATVRLREVETALSVAQAGSELMPDKEQAYHSDHADDSEKSNVVKFTI